MNKRLQELYLVASEQFKIVQDQGLPAPYQTRAFAEKFAELIIRECMMVVEGFTIEQEVALDDYQEYEASAVLKEHFGVEE
jgi:hypothetical protein